MTYRMLRTLAAGFLALAGSAMSARAVEGLNEITVSAGTVDRHDSVVTFTVDPAKAGGDLDLATEGVRGSTPRQVRPDGRASFIVSDLKAGQSRTYKIIMVKRAEAPRD